MKFRLLLFSFLLCFSVADAAPVQLAGQVINDTHNKPAGGANLEFVKARDGQTPSMVGQVKADTNGRFAIKINLGADDLVFARCNWTGHMYVAPVYDGTGKMNSLGVKFNPANLKLHVYDATTEMVPLAFLVHHLAIESKPGGLKCVERIVVENPTKKVFLGIGKHRATILINLPEGARNVVLDKQITDAKIEKRSDGWAIIKPIAPSVGNSIEQNAIIINYDMEWPSALPWKRTLDFSRKIQYPTKFFFVAREESDKKLNIIAPQLSKDESAPLNVDGQAQTRIVNAAGRPMQGKPVLQAGDDLKVQVTLPVEPLFWGFLGFVVLLVVAVPVAIFSRPRSGKIGEKSINKNEEPPPAEFVSMPPFALEHPGGAPQFSPEVQELIGRIARLDEDFAKGNMQADQYQAQRRSWKNDIVEQLLQTTQTHEVPEPHE